MNPHIENALKCLENANYAGYFEEMDKVEIPKHLKTTHEEHRGRFMAGKESHNFAQQLRIFAKEVDKSLFNDRNGAEEADSQENHSYSPPSLPYFDKIIVPLSIVFLVYSVYLLLTTPLYCSQSNTYYQKISLLVIDKQQKPLGGLEVNLAGSTESGKFSNKTYNFRVEEGLDTLRFNIKVLGVDTSYVVPNNGRKQESFQLDLEENELKEIEKRFKYFIEEGQDSSGRIARFSIIIVDRSHYWTAHNTTSIYNAEINGMQQDICSFILSKYSLLHRIWLREGVIAVGNACQEPYGPERNSKIAYERAKTLADCFANIYNKRNIFLLNLGQHKEIKTDNIDIQRSILIVGILAKQEGVNKNEALYDAFKKLETMPFDIDNFHNVDAKEKRFKAMELYP
ncbi:MAG: hypothetical protein JJT94_05630 [Bernardetiaceae bacterium]|nr:hypothetical protein [Bernardetiaceae bacterium]